MALVGSLSAYLASHLSLQFGLLLLATVFASGRGWGAVPFVILAISELPKLFAHVFLGSLGMDHLAWMAFLVGSLSLGQWAILITMILAPRVDPRRSAGGLLVMGFLVACAPLLLIGSLGGLEALPGKGGMWITRRAGAAPAPEALETAAATLPERLIGTWEGGPVVDAEGLERALTSRNIGADADRRQAREQLEAMRLRITYRSDGSSSTTLENAVVLREGRVAVIPRTPAIPQRWKVLREGDHFLQLESLENGAVVAITFLGDDTILSQTVSGERSGFVNGYRLKRKRSLW